MGLHQYLRSLNDLEKIYRAPGYFKFEQHSVAAHSFRVAEIAQLLGDLENLNGNPVNWRQLYEKSLNHDYTERFIGDIKTPVKYASHSLREMLATVESSMATILLIMKFRKTYEILFVVDLEKVKMIL